VTILSSPGHRYLMVDKGSHFQWKPDQKPAFASPNFHLYSIGPDTLRDMENAAYKLRVRISYIYAFWSELGDRDWRIKNYVRKVL